MAAIGTAQQYSHHYGRGTPGTWIARSDSSRQESEYQPESVYPVHTEQGLTITSTRTVSGEVAGGNLVTTGGVASGNVYTMTGDANVCVVSIPGTEQIISDLYWQPVQLKELPRPRRIVTRYEPHLREKLVRTLVSLFDRFEVSLGTIEAPTRILELREYLTDAYRQSLQAQTRNLATAISMLQDLTRPHWTQISREKVKQISGVLQKLSEERNLSANVLGRYYQSLVDIVGTGIILEMNDDEEEKEEADERRTQAEE